MEKVVAWRAKATELRSKAEALTDPRTKQTLLELADGWDGMASRREEILHKYGPGVFRPKAT